ncbi:MAG: winged helix-turn-helix domain-containing protein [Bdellovibrionota bacterium]
MNDSNRQWAPELLKALDLAKLGKTDEARKVLDAFVKSGTGSNADLLKAYGHLIRLAGESFNLDQVPTYIEAIKNVPVQNDVEKSCFAECLYSIGVGWSYLGDRDKARKNLDESLTLTEQTGDQKLSYRIRLGILELLRQEGKYQEVLSGLDELEKTTANSSNNLPGACAILRGDSLRKLGQYREALLAYEKAKEHFVANKNSPFYHYTLWALGTCYAALEDKEKAVIYLELASHNSQSIEFWRINIRANLTLAELHTITGDYTAAEDCYRRVAEHSGTDENSYYGKRYLRGLALLHTRMGQYEKADEIIDKLVVSAVRDQKQGDIMRIRLLKAEVLLRSGEAAQQEEARAMLQEALAFYTERNILRHKASCLELLARLDSTSGYPQDSLKKVNETLKVAAESSFDRLYLRAALAKMILERKLGTATSVEDRSGILSLINKLNARAERVILARFDYETYDEWSAELRQLDTHAQRFVNEFFDDFHFVPKQSVDLEIDRNSNYVREKHLGEIPFHNKFTLMKILLLLAETPGKEFSKEVLAKEVWGQDYNPLRHDNNIYININRLRKLLEPNPRESRYVMNGSKGYYFNPSMKVNISSRISDVAPRSQGIATVKEL